MRKESTSSQNAPTFTCVVCGKDNELVSIGSCDHRRVCSYCSMKSRLHYDYKKCPICLKILDEIFICEFTDKTPYATLVKKKDEFYEDEEFDKCHIYFTTIEGKEEALRLRGFNCPIRSCRSEPFENINSLSEHLNKIHKRFYCPYCLKENKTFLSEMNIYNKKNLEEHIKYGEYDKKEVISPPHPSCPFDSTTFYNDEKMFAHMNSFHFICQLCRDKKNIIFYPELNNLLQHYKDNHYCCPFQECLADVYVVFGKEEELISHLITKHKVENANERLNKLVFERKNSDGKELLHEKGEFNFSEYINNLKEESEKYRKNNNKNRFIHINEDYSNGEQVEDDYYYKNNKYDNKYNNKYNDYGNYNNNGYHKYNKYGKNDNYNNNRGRGGKNNRGNNRNYYNKYNNFWQHNNNNYNYYNKQDKNYEQNDYNNNNYKQVEIELNDDNANKIYEIKKQEPKQNKEKYHNKYNENENYHQKKYKKDVDYAFLFSFYLNIIKKLITDKIIKENIDEKLVKLPKETIYQIIVMIDKFDSNEKLLELTYLNNFGIDLNIHKELKSIISSNSEENEKQFKDILKNMDFKKLLIIYKYLYVCSRKVDNLFYRLDLEQIDEDLYEDFVQRKKKEEENLSQLEKDKRKRQMQLKSQLNVGVHLSSEDKKVTEVSFNKKEKNQQHDKKEEQKKEESNKNKPKSNLEMLLNNEIDENKESNNKKKGKKKKGKYVDFNIKDFDLEKDFPKLK